MAYNEVRAHLEIMEECGDIRWVGDKGDIVEATGTKNFVTEMGKYLG